MKASEPRAASKMTLTKSATAMGMCGIGAKNYNDVLRVGHMTVLAEIIGDPT
ncbi:hypothetical protein KCP69_06190 [Salmonella enterica subsp. enterica]|nr:hypothetical protein KCP69_06190 [Salmonella enterica subsp. enterica]